MVLGWLVLTLVLAGCSAEQYAPGEGPPPGVPTTPSGGGGGAPGIDRALVGEWRNVLICAPQFGCGGGDVLRITTSWTFAQSGTCTRRVITESVGSDIPLITVTGCRWRSSAHSRLQVTYDGNTSPVEFSYTFVNFNSDHLSLNGIEFTRVS